MKIEEQQQISQSEAEMIIMLDEQKRFSRQVVVTREMSHISEIHQESEIQSNNNPARGSFGGATGLNHSYTTSGGAPGGSNLTPNILDKIPHRHSMDAVGRT